MLTHAPHDRRLVLCIPYQQSSLPATVVPSACTPLVPQQTSPGLKKAKLRLSLFHEAELLCMFIAGPVQKLTYPNHSLHPVLCPSHSTVLSISPAAMPSPWIVVLDIVESHICPLVSYTPSSCLESCKLCSVPPGQDLHSLLQQRAQAVTMPASLARPCGEAGTSIETGVL